MGKKSKAAKKVYLTPTRRQTINSWHQCCDTRAVAAVVMHLHAVTKGLFFTAADIADWVIENNYDPADWEAAPDLLEAFGNRPSIEITEAVTICADVLCGNGVLLVDCVQHTTGALVNVYQVQFEAYDVLFDIYPKLADALDLVVLQVMESAE